MYLRKTAIAALLTSGLAGVSGQAFAHWSSGPFLYNDAGTNPMFLANSNLALGVENNGTGANGPGTFGTNTATGTTYGTYTQTRSTGSDYGWSAAQDPVTWGNSHDNKGLAFSLAATSKVSFQIDTLGAGLHSVVQTQATGGTAVTDLRGNDWTPAFALFRGLATQSSHEGGNGNNTLDANLPGYATWSPYAAANPFSPASEALYEATTGQNYTDVAGAEGTWGAYRSNANWTAGRDISATATFGNGTLIGTDQTLGGQNTRVLEFLGSETAAPGTHSLTSVEYILGPGDYSIWVGGNNPANAALQIQNYKDLVAAHAANDATVATQQAAFNAAATPEILAALAVYNAAAASHTLTLAEKAAALVTFQGVLATSPTAETAYNAWQTAAAPITTLDAAIADLRLGHAFTIQTTVAPVPIPGAVWLFGSALAGLLGLARRKA
ncbi:MAG: hypothetical protein ACKN9T_15040 [Candidatus Methylumidiphilus sp.]